MPFSGWFRGKRVAPPLDGIAFDRTGMTHEGVQNGQSTWTTADGDSLFAWCNLRSKPLARMSVDQMKRSIVSGLAEHPVKLVELSPITIDGCPVLRMIRKGPQRPTDMTYTATLSFLFRDFAPVIAVMCPERGMTGLREAVLLDRLLGTGEVTITQPPRIDGNWNPDDKRYDPEFPEHPLSRARRLLAHVERTCRLSSDWRSHRTAKIF
jgi:hypothetical protein